MTKQTISPEQSYTCPKCGMEWRMLEGDTNESIVRCMACCERFQIGAHLTKHAQDAASPRAHRFHAEDDNFLYCIDCGEKTPRQ